jgi:hypothetical protein
MTDARSQAASGWLIDKRNDLLYMVGAVVVSYALIAAHILVGVSAIFLWWLWTLFMDGPHIFATLSRTYLDRQERAERGPLLWGSLAWFALGPASIGASYLLDTNVPYLGFYGFFNVWAYWHVVRQHFGFMNLYKRKNDDGAPVDNRLDPAVLYVGLLAPFASYVLTNPMARKILGLTEVERPWESWAVTAAWSAVGAVALAAALRQLQRALRGERLNRGKLLFWAAALPLSWVTFSPWMARHADFQLFTVAVTSFHNIQYNALVWHYQKRRYHSGGTRGRAFGLAYSVSRRFWPYAALAVAFSAVYRGVQCGFGAIPGCSMNFSGSPLWPGGLTQGDLAVAFFLGIPMHHYYLDQKIWRLRKDPALNRDLGLVRPASA